MSAAETWPTSEQVSASAPRDIRAHLLPEEVPQFDREWAAAISTAATDLDLGGVLTVLARWRLIAKMTEADPAAHRRMLQRAERSVRGESEPTVPVDELRFEIARRLGE